MSVGKMHRNFFLVLLVAVSNTGFAFRGFLPSLAVPKCPDGVFLCTLDDAVVQVTNGTTLNEKVGVAINMDVIRLV